MFKVNSFSVCVFIKTCDAFPLADKCKRKIAVKIFSTVSINYASGTSAGRLMKKMISGYIIRLSSVCLCVY